MDEFHEWMRKNEPVVMQIQPTPGTDEHGYGQLVKLLREKACVSHSVPAKSRPLTLLTVCCCELGDSRKGPAIAEPPYRAILAGPPWCSIPDQWNTRDPETSSAVGSRVAPGNPQQPTTSDAEPI
jgi:hypothetical protein